MHSHMEDSTESNDDGAPQSSSHAQGKKDHIQFVIQFIIYTILIIFITFICLLPIIRFRYKCIDKYRRSNGHFQKFGKRDILSWIWTILPSSSE